MSVFDFLDKDNDGGVLDDWFKLGAQAGGGLMKATGDGMKSGSAGFGPFGPIVGVAGSYLQAGGDAVSTFGGDVAEEVGDFATDAAGIRQAKPYAKDPTTDPHYNSGRTDGLGQQLNRWLGKNGPSDPGSWLGPIGAAPDKW